MTSEDDKVSLFLGGFDEDRQAGILGSLNLGGRSGVDLTHSLTDICCLSFSPDGSFLVVGCEDGRLCALSVAGQVLGECRFVLRGGVRAVHVLVRNTHILAAGRHGDLAIFEVGTWQLLNHEVGHTVWVSDFKLAPDESFAIAAHSDGVCQVWTLPSLAIQLEFTQEYSVLVCGVLRGLELLTIDVEGMLQVWDSITGTRLRLLQLPGAVNALHISVDAPVFVTGTSGGSVTLWDADILEPLWNVVAPQEVEFLLFSPEHDYVLVCGSLPRQLGSRLSFLHLADGSVRQALQCQQAEFYCAAYPPKLDRFAHIKCCAL
eukprot:m.161521 g.161521  ORF g.161521 m.161521 type:complete len:318 (-) comp53040_c0_seq40:68-1021(-)